MHFTFHIFGYRIAFECVPQDSTSWHGWATLHGDVWCDNCGEKLVRANPGIKQRIDFDHVCKQEAAA